MKMDSTLVSLVYYSSAQHFYTDADLAQLLETCRRNNKSCGVTGMLLYHDGNFIQALEGPLDSVMSVFDRVQEDPRHTGILSTGTFPIDQRQFPNWNMGVLHKRALDAIGQKAVDEFLSRRPVAATDDTAIAWDLLNGFRASADRAA